MEISRPFDILCVGELPANFISEAMDVRLEDAAEVCLTLGNKGC